MSRCGSGHFGRVGGALLYQALKRTGNVAPLYRHLIGWSSPHADAKTPPRVTNANEINTIPSVKSPKEKAVCCSFSSLSKRATSGAAAPAVPYQKRRQLQVTFTFDQFIGTEALHNPAIAVEAIAPAKETQTERLASQATKDSLWTLGSARRLGCCA